MNEKIHISIDKFEMPSEQPGESYLDKGPLTLWVNNKTKERFAKLQEKSNKKFGKHLVAVLSKVISETEL